MQYDTLNLTHARINARRFRFQCFSSSNKASAAVRARNFRKQEMDKYRCDDRWKTRRNLRLVDMLTYGHEFVNQFSYYLIDNSSYRLIFYLDKKDEIYHYSSKEHFQYFSIRRGENNHFRLKYGYFYRT
jgi:hypothetical protein